ncbi:MAG: dicarboxylate/amino acid:cation symporter, partial [Phycisphaerales bacterium]
FFARVNPFDFMWRMKRALLTAFGTDSSSATLPVTIETAQDEAGCSKRASGFVLPLGATVNMDGTALYEAVAVVFLFQLYGIALGGAEFVVVVVTATLAAVGAAGIPSAGLVTMVLVVQAVNASLGNDPARSLPIEAIGIIIGVDRILDMVRTMVNVQGDMTGARLLTRLAPDDPDPAHAGR